MEIIKLLGMAIVMAGLLGSAAMGSILSGFERSPWFGEQIRDEKTPEGIRMRIIAPSEVRPDRPTQVIFYATPNGNTLEQTLGCALVPDLDWHYDIQHAAAQVRRIRELNRRENLVLACLEAEGLSWPAWRQKHTDNAALIRQTIEKILHEIPGKPTSAVLTGHSGGGSMTFGFLNAYEEIPEWVSRIAFLDSNYAYSDEEHHGEKLLAWLRKDAAHRLVVIAYDDRNITLNGKRVVSDTGGTYRATHRMINKLASEAHFSNSLVGEIERYQGLGGQIQIYLHRNSANKILHTVLVGEMNGCLEALSSGTCEEGKWGQFGEPRAYTHWIEPAKFGLQTLPARPKDAPSGSAIMKRVAKMTIEEREAVILAELKRGNLPDFLRAFKTIRVKATDSEGREHTLCYQVMPDYLAVGSDKDSVRVPITPMTAQALADSFQCCLTTRKMADDIYKQAELKLEPHPLTEAREAVETFAQHSAIIEGQRAGKPLGLLVAGIKKDVVITNRLQEKPHRVAIYGWHKLDGSPIQPLTIVHKDTYVDYSHGIRLVKRAVLVDGKPRDMRDILADPNLCGLASDEGPMKVTGYDISGPQAEH